MIAISQLSTELQSDSGLVRAVDALSLTISPEKKKNPEDA